MTTPPTTSLLLLLLLPLLLLLLARCCQCRGGSSPAYLHHQQQQQQMTNASSWWKQQRPAVTAVIAFGDSIVDPGNNNGLHTLIKANHPPYGKDLLLLHGQPTGRYSNGFIPTDLIAQELGVKQLVPAYLAPEDVSPEDLVTGVSFASGATGFDPLTPVVVNVISMDQQLAYFDEYRGRLAEVVAGGEEEAARVVEGALFVVCAGTDDVANTYFTTPLRSAQYDIPSYVDLLVRGAESFLKELSGRGARKIGFVGMPPVGCVPSQRTLGGGLGRECEPTRNEAARLYNARVQDMIAGLNSSTTLVVFLDIYRVLEELIEHGGDDGFSETTRGCCGTGTIEVTGLCDSRFVSVCDDASQYLFFDSYHPTERAYRIIVDDIFSNYAHLLF